MPSGASDSTQAYEQLQLSVAERFGTPTYLYDLTRVTQQVNTLRELLPGALWRYAVKANANGALLRHVAGLGVGAEALTWGELERCLRAGFDPAHILLGGPGHTQALAARALEVGVGLVSLDGEGAYNAWQAAMRQAQDAKVRFLVRLNPGFDPHTHEHLATAAAASKFGLQASAATALAEKVAADGRLAGFHVHAGSMLFDAEVARLVVQSLAPLYRRFPGLDLVDLGGGFGVPDAPVEQFIAVYAEFVQQYDLTPLFEPGRLVVAEAGTLLTRVLHVKEGARRHVIADAGMSDLLRPALYGARHPVRLLGRQGAPYGPAPTDLDGPLCENADRLAQDADLPQLLTGDLLAVEHAGAYGFAMASNYASSLRPAEVVWNGQELRLARRRELPSDLWRLEEELA